MPGQLSHPPDSHRRLLPGRLRGPSVPQAQPQRQPLIDEPVRHIIAERSHGLPLHLSVMRYLELRRWGRQPQVTDFDHGFPALITRTLRDLTPEERHVLRSVSLLTRSPYPGPSKPSAWTTMHQLYACPSAHSSGSPPPGRPPTPPERRTSTMDRRGTTNPGTIAQHSDETPRSRRYGSFSRSTQSAAAAHIRPSRPTPGPSYCWASRTACPGVWARHGRRSGVEDLQEAIGERKCRRRR